MEDRGIDSWQKRFSLVETDSTDQSSKVRVYDKTSHPAQISPLTRIAALENTINNLLQHPIGGVQQHSNLILPYKSSKVRVYDKTSQPGEISPLRRIAALETAINNLHQHTIEGVHPHFNLIQHYKYKFAEISQKKQNEMLQEDLDCTKRLLESQTHRAEESIVQNVRLSKQVEELTKICEELQEYCVKILQEKKEQTMEFESLHVDLEGKLSSLAAAKLLLEKKTNSLQRELDGMSQKNGELQQTHVKILQEKEEHIMEFESVHADLQEQLSSLAAAKLLLEEKMNSLQAELDKMSQKFGELHETHAKVLLEKEEQRIQSESVHLDLQEHLSSLAVAKLFLEEKTNSLQGELDRMTHKNGELQEIHVKILQEKEEQRMESESLHIDLQEQISSLAAARMFLEEETNSLQSELDRRKLVSEEEKVNMNGILTELETAMYSLNKDLESSRTMEEEKEEQIDDLRHQLLDIAKAKTCLEQRNNSLVAEMKKCTKENSLLQNRIKELETALNCVKDLESKDVQLQELTECQSLQMDSHLRENGKPKCLNESENGRENLLPEKPQSKVKGSHLKLSLCFKNIPIRHRRAFNFFPYKKIQNKNTSPN